MLPLSVVLASFTNTRPPAAPALQRSGPRVRGGDTIHFPWGLFFLFPAATFDSLRGIRALRLALRGGPAAPAWVRS